MTPVKLGIGELNPFFTFLLLGYDRISEAR